MALLHDFLLREEGTHRYEDYRAWVHAPDAVRIQDDVLHYLNDTLRWIPAFNPAQREPVDGLCLYGVTVINRTGAAIAAQLFQRWADLFALGPEPLVLTGSYGVEIDGTAGYSKLQVDKDALVGSLRTLAQWARRVEGGRQFIAHLGL